ncbi:MAG TPA: zinc-binding alcohol dehydrogenase, partial [Thermoleophilia bacterium]|nr:zinc-binding alcohol dehydrogenase [Thermoleophilia bacterium]
MKQLFQDMKSGETILAEVPTPQLQPGFVKIRTHYSVVSAGTERMVMELGKKSYLGKARARPDLAMKVLQKVKTEGLMSTFRQTMARLEAPLPLGYSSAGEVVAVGEGVFHVQPGDRVACGGGGWATHAEVAAVPANLCVRIPEGVSTRDAAYATVGAIALQGIRIAEAKVGETVAVIGLGIVGQLTVQLLRASGCLVVGFDPDPGRVEVAGRWATATAATEDACERETQRASRGRGADAVIITAATSS